MVVNVISSYKIILLNTHLVQGQGGQGVKWRWSWIREMGREGDLV